MQRCPLCIGILDHDGAQCRYCDSETRETDIAIDILEERTLLSPRSLLLFLFTTTTIVFAGYALVTLLSNAPPFLGLFGQ